MTEAKRKDVVSSRFLIPNQPRFQMPILLLRVVRVDERPAVVDDFFQ